MDDMRRLLITICASLARLQIRLIDKRWMANWTDSARRRDATYWVAGDVDPASPWLDAMPSNTALGGVINRISLVQAQLIGDGRQRGYGRSAPCVWCFITSARGPLE
jgi:hypothetical protein